MAAANSFDMVLITTKKTSIKGIFKMNLIQNKALSHDINFKNIFTKDNLETLFKDNSRSRIFDPLTTLYCFLYQVLNQCSSKSAIIHLNMKRLRDKEKTISLNTSAFTKAKQRLCSLKIFDLLILSGQKISKQAKLYKWKGRDVLLGDGTVINLEDTDDIKKKYPLTFSKGAQQGQPKLRLMGLFCHASGAFIDGEIASYKGKGTSEPTLLLKILERLKPRTVLILDRFFTSLHLQKIMKNKHIDYVTRARDDFAKKYLGRSKDKIVELT